MLVRKAAIGKKVVYDEERGYFLVQGLEQHGTQLFAYGLLAGGHTEGLRPNAPKHPRKAYYIVNSDDQLDFKKYKARKTTAVA